jgi:hypothetical protein
MQRLCCGSPPSTQHLFGPLFQLGSLSGTDLLNALFERLAGIYKKHSKTDCNYENIWSEAHMPAYMAVLEGRATNMRQIYELKLQPERQELTDLKIIEAGPLRFRAQFMAALSQTAESKGKELITRKLIEKCCFGAATGQGESVRYIRAQFAKAFGNNPDSLAALVGSCLYLGTVPQGPMPPPEKRIEFHRNPTHFIKRMMTILPSRTLWVCLIYTVTSMCDSDPIFAKMRKLYYGLAIHEDVQETLERKDIVIGKAIPALHSDTAIDGSRCRKRMRTRRPLDLTKALGSVTPQKRRLTETSVMKLFPDAKSGTEAKMLLAPLYRAVLEFAPRKPVVDDEMLKSLGLAGEDGANIYMHAIQQRQTLSLIPRNALLQRFSTRNRTKAKVCLDCFTLRSKPRDAAANKATDGTILKKDGSEVCAACQSTRCVEFCVNPFIVSSLNKHTDSKTLKSQVCSGCGFLSVISHYVGIHPYCESCRKSLSKQSEANLRCGVCEKVLSKRSHYMQVLRKNPVGHPTEITVCNLCSCLGIPDSPEPWQIKELKVLLRSRHRQCAQFGITFPRSGHRGGIIAARKT